MQEFIYKKKQKEAKRKTFKHAGTNKIKNKTKQNNFTVKVNGRVRERERERKANDYM